MSYFKAKIYQIRFRLGLCPRPRWRSLQRSPDPLAGFKGPTSKWMGGKGKGGERRAGQGGQGKGREGRWGGREGIGKGEGVEGEWGSPTRYFRLNSCTDST